MYSSPILKDGMLLVPAGGAVRLAESAILIHFTITERTVPASYRLKHLFSDLSRICRREFPEILARIYSMLGQPPSRSKIRRRGTCERLQRWRGHNKMDDLPWSEGLSQVRTWLSLMNVSSRTRPMMSRRASANPNRADSSREQNSSQRSCAGDCSHISGLRPRTTVPPNPLKQVLVLDGLHSRPSSPY